jgi:multicomponent Na+:H+ antiporter subunit G
VNLLIVILLLLGGGLAFISALGVLRLPDTLIRMHAATKAGTLGAGFILAAVGLYFHETATTLRAAMVIVFLLLTAPVAAHLIGRAAYRTGIRLWQGTWVDQLRSDRGAIRTSAQPGRDMPSALSPGKDGPADASTHEQRG